MLRRALLVGGILSSLLYVAMNVFVPMQWPGYSSAAQTVSELSAIGAPTRPLWVPLGIAYTLLVAAFGWGVRISAGRNRPLRVAGDLMVVYGLIGLVWPPMHQRHVLAAGGGTLTDTLHIAWAMVTVLLMLLAMSFGAAALGRRFRYYSIATMCHSRSVWRVDDRERSPSWCKSSHAVGRDLGADQHWRLPALGRRTGRDAGARRGRGMSPGRRGTRPA